MVAGVPWKVTSFQFQLYFGMILDARMLHDSICMLSMSLVALDVGLDSAILINVYSKVLTFW